MPTKCLIRPPAIPSGLKTKSLWPMGLIGRVESAVWGHLVKQVAHPHPALLMLLQMEPAP